MFLVFPDSLLQPNATEITDLIIKIKISRKTYKTLATAVKISTQLKRNVNSNNCFANSLTSSMTSRILRSAILTPGFTQ